MNTVLLASLFIGTGAFAGFMSGLLGIGGGVIIVPALLFIFHKIPHISTESIMHLAIGTSLAIVLITAKVAVYAHHRIGQGILWSVFRSMLLYLGLGTISGCITANHLSTEILESLFALFLFSIATKLFFDRHKPSKSRTVNPPLHRIISFFIGFLSGLFGIGGGILIVPYLAYTGVDLRKIAAISSLSTLTVASVGSLSYIIAGLSHAGLPAYSSGYIFWPAVIATAIPSALTAPLGAKLSYVLPIKHLRYVFILFIIFTALNLVF